MTKPILLTLLVTGLYLLHQDYWNWKSIEPLVLGFLPIGLAYHVGYSIAAALTMAVLVRFAWPKDLSPDEQPAAIKPNEPK